MGFWIRRGAVLLALLGGVGLAALDQRATDANTASRSIRPAFADDEATGSIGRLANASALPLTDEQRGLVFLGVMNLPDVPEADVDAPDPTVPLSDSVELRDLRDHRAALRLDHQDAIIELDELVICHKRYLAGDHRRQILQLDRTRQRHRRIGRVERGLRNVRQIHHAEEDEGALLLAQRQHLGNGGTVDTAGGLPFVGEDRPDAVRSEPILAGPYGRRVAAGVLDGGKTDATEHRNE